MYKYVFLDLDDTIWDFKGNAKAALREAYYTLKIDQDFNDFEHFFSIYIEHNDKLWDLYGTGQITREHLMKERFLYPLLQVGITNDDLPMRISELYMQVLPMQPNLVAYARDLLDYLFAKYPLTIISNGFTETQYKKLRNTQIEQYFKHVVLSETVKSLKPDKKIFEHALHLNNALPEEAVMIGDIFQADIIGAQNAGIDQIFYNWRKYKFKEGEKATYMVDSLKDIFDIL